MYRILLIGDERAAVGPAARALETAGHAVVCVDAADAIWQLEDGFDIVMSGVPARATESGPRGQLKLPPSILSVTSWEVTDVLGAVQDLDARARLESAQAAARRALRGDDDAIVGASPELRRAKELVTAAATSGASVLLRGESGTGKELFARALHAQSARAAAPLVAVNCASFPDTLLEAELFGHERGAFTGATQRREGRFKAADGGTLFLDEVNGLSMAAQAKLLRVLADGTFQPIGTNTTVAVDVRLISATNRDLRAMVAAGTFREDLFYRIRVLEIELPPLRARRGDLPILVQHFLAKLSPRDRVPRLTPRAWAAIASHDFPGNVRELEHALQHAVVLAQGRELDLEHLPRDLWPTGVLAAGAPADVPVRHLSEVMLEFERTYVQRALAAAGGSRTRAAQLLGISRKTLWERLRRHHEADHADPDPRGARA